MNILLPSWTVRAMRHFGGVGPALLVAAALWLGFALLGYQRMQTPWYLAKMELMARVITATPAVRASGSTVPATVTSDDIKLIVEAFEIKQHKAGLDFKFFPETLRPDFYATAAAVANDKGDEPSFKSTWSALNKLGRQYSPALPHEPTYFERFHSPYFKTWGVEFRPLSSGLAVQKREASRFLSDLQDNFADLPVEEYLFPWLRFEFYDPARATLDRYIAVALPLLILSVGLLLQYLLVDYVVDDPIGDRLRRRSPWTIVWASSLDKQYLMIGTVPCKVFDGLLWIVGFGLVAGVELSLNNPEFRSEWFVNVPVMLLVGPLVIVMLVAMLQFAFTPLNPDLANFKRAEIMVFFSSMTLAIYGTIVSIAVMATMTVWTASRNHDPGFFVRECVQLAWFGAAIAAFIGMLVTLHRRLQFDGPANEKFDQEFPEKGTSPILGYGSVVGMFTTLLAASAGVRDFAFDLFKAGSGG